MTFIPANRFLVAVYLIGLVLMCPPMLMAIFTAGDIRVGRRVRDQMTEAEIKLEARL